MASMMIGIATSLILMSIVSLHPIIAAPIVSPMDCSIAPQIGGLQASFENRNLETWFFPDAPLIGTAFATLTASSGNCSGVDFSSLLSFRWVLFGNTSLAVANVTGASFYMPPYSLFGRYRIRLTAFSTWSMSTSQVEAEYVFYVSVPFLSPYVKEGDLVQVPSFRQRTNFTLVEMDGSVDFVPRCDESIGAPALGCESINFTQTSETVNYERLTFVQVSFPPTVQGTFNITLGSSKVVVLNITAESIPTAEIVIVSSVQKFGSRMLIHGNQMELYPRLTYSSTRNVTYHWTLDGTVVVTQRYLRLHEVISNYTARTVFIVLSITDTVGSNAAATIGHSGVRVWLFESTAQANVTLQKSNSTAPRQYHELITVTLNFSWPLGFFAPEIALTMVGANGSQTPLFASVKGEVLNSVENLAATFKAPAVATVGNVTIVLNLRMLSIDVVTEQLVIEIQPPASPDTLIAQQLQFITFATSPGTAIHAAFDLVGLLKLSHNATTSNSSAYVIIDVLKNSVTEQVFLTMASGLQRVLFAVLKGCAQLSLSDTRTEAFEQSIAQLTFSAPVTEALEVIGLLRPTVALQWLSKASVVARNTTMWGTTARIAAPNLTLATVANVMDAFDGMTFGTPATIMTTPLTFSSDLKNAGLGTQNSGAALSCSSLVGNPFGLSGMLGALPTRNVITIDLMVDGRVPLVKQLSTPVTLTFSQVASISAAVVCAFWNATVNSWSTEGVTTTVVNVNTTLCTTTHLGTSFALFECSPNPTLVSQFGLDLQFGGASWQFVLNDNATRSALVTSLGTAVADAVGINTCCVSISDLGVNVNFHATINVACTNVTGSTAVSMVKARSNSFSNVLSLYRTTTGASDSSFTSALALDVNMSAAVALSVCPAPPSDVLMFVPLRCGALSLCAQTLCQSIGGTFVPSTSDCLTPSTLNRDVVVNALSVYFTCVTSTASTVDAQGPLSGDSVDCASWAAETNSLFTLFKASTNRSSTVLSQSCAAFVCTRVQEYFNVTQDGGGACTFGNPPVVTSYPQSTTTQQPVPITTTAAPQTCAPAPSDVLTNLPGPCGGVMTCLATFCTALGGTYAQSNCQYPTTTTATQLSSAGSTYFACVATAAEGVATSGTNNAVDAPGCAAWASRTNTLYQELKSSSSKIDTTLFKSCAATACLYSQRYNFTTSTDFTTVCNFGVLTVAPATVPPQAPTTLAPGTQSVLYLYLRLSGQSWGDLIDSPSLPTALAADLASTLGVLPRDIVIDNLALGSLVVQFHAQAAISADAAKQALLSLVMNNILAAYRAGGGTDSIGILDVGSATQASATMLVTNLACDYKCRSTSSGGCVSLFALCDGTRDCSGSEDEAMCFLWQEVEGNSTLPLPETYRGSGSPQFRTTTSDKCRAIAMSNGSMAFAFSKATQTCVVYARTHSLVPSDRFYFTTAAAEGFSVFTVLSSPSQYLRCSDALTCSGHGYSAMNAAGVCGCVCDALYSGANCQDMQTIKAFSSVYVAFNESAAGQAVTPATIALALHAWFPKGDFVCELPLRASSMITFLCNDRKGELTAAEVANATTLDAFNRNLLSVSGPSTEKAVRLSSSAASAFEAQDNCVFDSDKKTVRCKLAGPTSVDAVIVQLATSDVQNSVITTKLNLVAGSTRASINTSSTRVVEVTCNVSQSTVTIGTNRIYRCLVDASQLPASSSLTDYNASLVNIATGLPSSLQSNVVDFVSSLRRSLQVPDVVATTTVTIVSQSFAPFRNAGIAMLVLGSLVLAAVITLLALHRRAVRRAGVSESEVSKERFAYLCLRRLALVEDPSAVSTREPLNDGPAATTTKSKLAAIHKRRAALLLLAVVLALWILGIFLILYYKYSVDVRRDTWPIIERYADDRCANSTFAPAPLAAFYVGDKDATICQRRQVIGAIPNSGGFYFAAWCDTDAAGNVIGQFRVGPSRLECEQSTVVTVRPGSCQASGTSWGAANDTTFTSFQCGSASSVFKRFVTLQSLSDPVVPTVRTTVKDANPLVDVQAFRSASTSGSLTKRLATLRSGRRVSTSPGSSFRIDTTSAADDVLAISVDPNALLIQSGLDLFTTFPAGVHQPLLSPHTASILAGVTTSMLMESVIQGVVPSSILAYVPSLDTPNLPIGILYNNFNTSRAKSLTAAGPGAARYYSVQSTAADVGTAVNGWASAMEVGNGFTARLYLKATPETQGFAFAVTDGVEDVVNGGSPILDVAISLMATNADASSWFDNDYHIYSSLYVDGPGRQLKFVTASPRTSLAASTQGALETLEKDGKRFQVLSWDLESMGLGRVLNGLWHEVVLTIRRTNNVERVQLTVDGESSSSEQAWSKCLAYQPEPVATLPLGAQVLTFKPTQSVSSGGLLWTGYLNGGVGNVEFVADVIDRFTIWLQSSPSVRAHNSVNRGGFSALGALLVAIALLLLAFTVWDTARSTFKASTCEVQELQDAARRRYYRFLHGTTDGDGLPLLAMPFAAAKRMLDVNDTEIVQLIEELEAAACWPVVEGPKMTGSQIFVAILWKQLKSNNGGAVLPHAEDWHFAVAEAESIKSSTCVMMCCGADEGEGSCELVESTEQTFAMPTKSNNGGGGGSSSANNNREEGDSDVDRAKPCDVDGEKESDEQVKRDSVLFHASFLRRFESTSQLLFPALSAIQALFLWMSTANIADTYRLYFENFFSFLSIDWVWAFGLPTIATPLIQMFVGLIIALALPYFFARDDARFLAYVARYALKRDEQQKSRSKHTDDTTANVHDTFIDPYGAPVAPSQQTSIELLAPVDRRRVDDFLKSLTPESIEVTPHPSRPIKLTRSDVTIQKQAKRTGAVLAPTLIVVPRDESCLPVPLELLGVRCPVHKQRLVQEFQTDVYPFLHARQCCTVTDGVQCPERLGNIFICAHGADRCPCDFALCSKHCRMSIPDSVLSAALGLLHKMKAHGSMWTVAFILMLVANAVYMPFIKTAIMILACHPMYQCEFTCHDFSDRKYLSAFYLAVCAVVVFGLGVPLMQSIQLYRRKGLLRKAFTLKEERLSVTRKYDFTSRYEWLRFVATDTSMLSGLYDSLRFEWFYLSPMLLLWKVIIICPAVFIPYGSLGQAVGVSVAQVSFAIFIFVTAPFLSPVTDLMYRVGEVHQLLFLGLQAIDTAERYQGRRGTSKSMAVFTFLYLCFVVLLVVWTRLKTTAEKKLCHRKMEALLLSVGLQSTKQASMYTVPLATALKQTQKSGTMDNVTDLFTNIAAPQTDQQKK